MNANDLAKVYAAAEERLKSVEKQLDEARKQGDENKLKIVELEGDVRRLKADMDKAGGRFWQLLLAVLAAVIISLVMAALGLKRP